MTRRQNWPGTDQVVPMSFRWSPAGNHNYTVALRHQSAKISDAIFEDCWIISEMYVPVSYHNCDRFLQQFFIKIRSKTNLFSIFPSYYEIWIHITDVQKQSFIKIIYLMAQYGLFFCIQHLSGNLFQLLCKLLCLLDTKA